MQGYIFLFLLKNIDCGHSVEPHRRGGSNVYQQYKFAAKVKKMQKKIYVFFFYFYNFKNLCILHRHVFVVFRGSG